MLGILKSSILNLNEQLEILTKTMEKWKKDTREPMLNPRDVRVSYKPQRRPKVAYWLVTMVVPRPTPHSAGNIILSTYKKYISLSEKMDKSKIRIPAR